MTHAFQIRSVHASSYTIPTDRPESDGTLEWNATTIVIAEVSAANQTGLGFTYAAKAAANVIESHLAPELRGKNALNIPDCWRSMVRAVRNIGRPGLVSMAISAIDLALWDLKAKITNLPLDRLLGAARSEVPIYGSGGFTSYSLGELEEQLGGWVSAGIPRVKMKVGRDPGQDLERVRVAREAIGREAQLFVDANGAYRRKEASHFAEKFRDFGVCWLEEPVSSDDLSGLRLLRDQGPPGLQIAAGEYGFDGTYFHRMLEAGAVDVLQIDATRCGGITGALEALEIARAFHIPVSAHCAPSMHLPLGCHSTRFLHLEYFHDHFRLERMLFEGAAQAHGGVLRPDPSAPGFGLLLKKVDALRFAA